MNTYRYYTYDSPFVIKRWLHRKRFNDLLHILNLKPSDTLLDYGCGDGFLLALCSQIIPSKNVYGYEPVDLLYNEAHSNLRDTGAVVFQSIGKLHKRKFSKITCLETCEHLNNVLIQKTFRQIENILMPNGIVVFSVPIEIGIPALFKNAFRLLKNNPYDRLTIKRYVSTALGQSLERNDAAMLSSLPYIYSHVGFNHRRFEVQLGSYFCILEKRYSPVDWLGSAMNNTVYYKCAKP